MIDKTVSTNIRNLREQKKLSQAELGDMIGVCANTISNYELGKTGIKNETITSIAKALGVEVEAIWPSVCVPSTMEDHSLQWGSEEQIIKDLKEQLKKETQEKDGLHALVDMRNAEIEKLKNTVKQLSKRVNELECKAAVQIKRDEFGAEQEND